MNNTNALAVSDAGLPAEIAEKVLVGGDLAALTPGQRLMYYEARCKAAGLDPRSRPFEYVTLKGKLTLYANKGAAEQLRQNHRVSIDKIEQQTISDILSVTVYGHTPDGRSDSDIGAVSIANLHGDDLANAIMKAITKGKRRLTFSLCGLNMLDETEIETINGARTFVDPPPGQRIQVVNPEHYLADPETGQLPDDGSPLDIPTDQDLDFAPLMEPNPGEVARGISERPGDVTDSIIAGIKQHQKRLKLNKQELRLLVTKVTGVAEPDSTTLPKEQLQAIYELMYKLKDNQAVADYMDSGHTGRNRVGVVPMG
jgi:hypothetical protein